MSRAGFPELKEWAQDVEIEASVPPCPEAKLLSQLIKPPENDPSELLRYRFLCRGGGALLVGPTGIGKSSLSMQAMVLWALGRDAFGIVPARPLKSLLIQAENDDGDLAEMRDGVITGLNLTSAEAQRACENIVVIREDSSAGLPFINSIVEPLLKAHSPDLLWIDPALAFLGAEASSQKDVSAFLRTMLNPLLNKYQCGCVVVHHTNKPASGKEKSDWSAGDFAYLGSGSIEWADWSRAVLAVRSIGSHSVFELRAAKRGARLQWVLEDGVTRTFAKLIAHGSEGGPIYWRMADASEAPEQSGPKQKRVHTVMDLMPHVPIDKAIAKESLRSKANGAGIPFGRINGLIAEAIADGELHEWRERRSGTNPRRLLARFPQPEGELER